MTSESAEKISLMQTSGVNINVLTFPPAEKSPKLKRATHSLLGRLRSTKNKSVAPPIDNSHHHREDNMELANEDAVYTASFEEHFADELSVKVCKDSIRLSLIENMKIVGSNVNCLFDIEKNGEISAEHIAGKYQSFNSKEKNLVFLWACFLKRVDLLEPLYRIGADLQSTLPNEGFTALHLAAFSGCVKCCEWLYSNGLHVNLVVQSLSPLECAVLGNSLGCTKLFLRHGAVLGKTVLHCAVQANATDCLKHLLSESATVNAVDENGLTALHVAADRGMDKCLQIIISHSPKVDLNLQTRWRKSTPLHLASENGYFECAQLLIDGGADVNVVNHKEQIALHLAAKAQSTECMEILLGAGSNVNAQDVDSRTPLHATLAKTLAAFNALEVLLKRGANVNISDKFGYTPLHLAALNEMSQCVDCLIMNGADVTARTHGGLSGLSIIGRKTPGSINSICRKLDSSISMNDYQASGREVDLKFDFRYLLQNSSAGEVGFLKALEEEGQKHLIEHPLCKAFLHLKWQKIRKFYLCRLFFSLLFVILLTVYMLFTLAHDCSSATSIICGNNVTSIDNNFNTANNNFTIVWNNCAILSNHFTTANNNLIMSDKNFTILNHDFFVANNKFTIVNNATICSFPRETHPFLQYIWYSLVLMAILKTIRKVISIPGHRSMKHYFYQPMNIFDWFVILSVLLVHHYWQGQTFILQKCIGALAVLLAWTTCMVNIGQLPVFGTYVAMFTKVQAEFFKLLFAYSGLLIGFTFCFRIVFPSEKSFQNSLIGFVKVIAMMTGDVDFSILTNYSSSKTSFLLSFSALITYTLFTLFVTIVLMNLLVGIAVRDIQGLQKTADLSKLIQQIELIYFLEYSICRGYVPRRIVQLLRQLTLVSPIAFRMVLRVKPLHPREKRLPKNVLLAAFNLAKQKQTWTNSTCCWSDTLRSRADCSSDQDEKNVYEELRQLKEMARVQHILISKLVNNSCSKVI